MGDDSGNSPGETCEGAGGPPWEPHVHIQANHRNHVDHFPEEPTRVLLGFSFAVGQER